MPACCISLPSHPKDAFSIFSIYPEPFTLSDRQDNSKFLQEEKSSSFYIFRLWAVVGRSKNFHLSCWRRLIKVLAQRADFDYQAYCLLLIQMTASQSNFFLPTIQFSPLYCYHKMWLLCHKTDCTSRILTQLSQCLQSLCWSNIKHEVRSWLITGAILSQNLCCLQEWTGPKPKAGHGVKK